MTAATEQDRVDLHAYKNLTTLGLSLHLASDSHA
jgi:hypothetical protein